MQYDSVVIQHMVENNKEKFNLRKAAEELQELALVLIQKTNKKDKFVDDQEVIDEIGDVLIRMEVLKSIFPINRIQDRVNEKTIKFQGYITDGKYSKF